MGGLEKILLVGTSNINYKEIYRTPNGLYLIGYTAWNKSGTLFAMNVAMTSVNRNREKGPEQMREPQNPIEPMILSKTHTISPF